MAARRPHRLVAHDDVRVDDWLWLRQKDDPQVRAYLAAENAWMEGETEHLGALRERLFREIVGRIQETDLSVPVRKGPWAYYSRTVEGLDYAIHCRRAAWAADGGSPPAEQVLLDENAAAAGSAFFALGGFAVSPDHRLAAWSFDAAGGERYELRLRDLDSGEDLPERIPDTYYGLAWASDSSTILYTRPDAAMRPWQVLAHRLGTPVDDDRIVHEEPDERFFVGLATTKDEQLLLVELQSQVTSEVRLLRAERPGDEPVVVEPRRQGIEYSVEHWGRRLLITTNDGAESFRLMWAPEDDPGRGAWRELLPCDPDVKLDGIDVMERHLLLYERAGGVRRIRSARLQGAGEVVAGSLRVVDQPEAVSTAWGSGNVEMATSTLRYEYTSLVTPRSVYDYDLDTGQATLLKRQPVLGDFDARRYRTWRLWAKAPDGTEIPVSVVARADTEADGTAPCLLYGYGAYEHSVEPTFSAMRLSLLDRGVVYAIAHVRGGGELGRHWYTDGKLLAKRNTFDDFVAAARHLVDSGWASPERLVARGASAGGLLMGAVANLAPEIFAGIVAQVPFVDCLTTISDETLPLTVIEWEEWGNPIADRAVYEYMKSYSPYDNVRSVQYPRMLVTAGLEDPRVGYWEPAKWVAKLRRQSPQSRILLKTEMGAGHMGPSGRYDSWREEAFVQAFVLDVLGLAQAEDDAPTDVNAKS
ncbi:MAG: S9 family peptidase [Acidimicrobiales bacterium]